MVRAKQATLAVAQIGIVAFLGSTLLLAGTAMADTTPTFAPGQVVDVYTWSWTETHDYQVSFSDPNGSVPSGYLQDVSTNFVGEKYIDSVGGYVEEVSFTVPDFGTQSKSVEVSLSVPGGGGVVARFDSSQAIPPITSGYGTTFMYTGAAAGQLPEVPWAAAIPATLLGFGVLWASKRRKSLT